MPRYMQFQHGTNVLEAARDRLRHVFATFDHVVVAFSGGKDSITCLMLTKEIAAEFGQHRVRAIFRDEEFIHQETVDFVERLRAENTDWLDLEWWAIPLNSVSYVLGETRPIKWWDPDRPWARQPPPDALTAEHFGLDPRVELDQHSADALACHGVRGRVAIVTGIRAAESIQRYRSCVNKLSENYLVACSTKQAMLARPIFDWLENDVFRYLYEYQIEYNPIYDAQLWGGANMRTSTAVNPQGAKVLHHLEGYDPELYERMLDVLPDMAVQRRYWDEWDIDLVLETYGHSFDGIEEWMRLTYTEPDQLKIALENLRQVRIRAAINPAAYPLRHVLQSYIRQSGRRDVLPIKGES